MSARESDDGAPTGSFQAIGWNDFARREPELADFGAEILTAAPAYLSIVRQDGFPRVHPVTPVISPLGLFLFMEPSSPKARDLRERGKFALHNGTPGQRRIGRRVQYQWACAGGCGSTHLVEWGRCRELHGARPLHPVRAAGEGGPLQRVRTRTPPCDP